MCNTYCFSTATTFTQTRLSVTFILSLPVSWFLTLDVNTFYSGGGGGGGKRNSEWQNVNIYFLFFFMQFWNQVLLLISEIDYFHVNVLTVYNLFTEMRRYLKATSVDQNSWYKLMLLSQPRQFPSFIEPERLRNDHESRPLDLELNQLNPVHTLIVYFIHQHFNIFFFFHAIIVLNIRAWGYTSVLLLRS
jgi:hypothetical protein